MKRGNRVLMFLVVIILILIAAAFYFIRSGGLPGTTRATESSPMVSIVVVGQPINMDDQIKAESLTTMPYAQANVTEKMVTDPQQVIGKYAAFPLAQGLPLTLDMVADRPGMSQPGSAAAKVVAPGLVAITVKADRFSLLANGIKDGDRVNLIATSMFLDVDPSYQTKLPNYTAKVSSPFAPETITASVKTDGKGTEQGRAELDPTINQALYLVPSEGQRPRLVSQMILQNVQVLHVGDFNNVQTQDAQAAAQATPAPNVQTTGQTDMITLIVQPQDAVALTYLMYSGAKFNLTLRAPDDTTRIETEAATLQYLLSQYAIPVPAKLPYVMDNSQVPSEPGSVAQPAP